MKKNNLNKAVILTLCSSLSLSIMALFVKLAASHTSNNMTVFFRFGISSSYIMLVLLIKNLRGQHFPIKTKYLHLHLFRSLVSVTGMLTFYYSLKYISLIDGTLFAMTNPLFVPILAVIFMGVNTDKKHWLAVIIGFIGVIFILKPGHMLFNPFSLVALLAGFLIAVVILIVRTLSKYDHPHTSMFYYFSFAFVIISIISIFHWQTPDLHTAILLFMVGIFGTAYQEFLIRASVYASAGIISSLLYSGVIFSGLLGWMVWGDIPDLLSWIGIALICCGGIMTVRSVK